MEFATSCKRIRILHGYEGVAFHCIRDAFFIQLKADGIMAVEIELAMEREV